MEDRGTRSRAYRADRSRRPQLGSPGTGFLQVEPRHLYLREQRVHRGTRPAGGQGHGVSVIVPQFGVLAKPYAVMSAWPVAGEAVPQIQPLCLAPVPSSACR